MAITLSGGNTDIFISTYADELTSVCQQKMALLESAVMHESVAGTESKSFDMIDKIEMQRKEGTNPETPRNDISTQRRWLFHDPFQSAVQLDEDDDLEMKLDRTGPITREFRYARNRKVDDIILSAFEMQVQSGRRNNSGTLTWAGQSGDIKYTDTSGGRTIPHDCSEGNCSASATGLTVEKVQLVNEYFAKMECDPEIPIFGLISPRQWTNLEGEEQYVNVDYNTDKPLATGIMLKHWMNINWIRSNKIVKGSQNDVDGDTDVFECWFWAKDGIILGVADSFSVKLESRADLSGAQQIRVHMNMGSMRHNEDKVIKMECQG